MRTLNVTRTDPKQTTPSEGSGPVLSCVVAYNQFGGYCIPTSSQHRPAAQHILAGDVWERDTLTYLTSHFGEGDAIHAGTYFGDFLPALSAACPDGSMIWAFEPNPENFRCAAITAMINDLENVHLTEAALGSTPGTARLLVKGTRGRSLGGASRIVSEPADAGRGHTVAVRIVVIDDIVPARRQVSLIHLDVEGSEREALAGALGTITRCRPILILEAVPADPWFSEAIISLGYAVVAGTDGNTILSSTPHDR